MMSGIRPAGVRAVILSCFLTGLVRAQVDVTTYHNDISRTGANTEETILTPANVNSTQFGKLFTTAVDGDVYAQPLYLAGVSIAGAAHNVLYIATEHDSVYAIDADSGAIYWQINLIPAGGRTVNSNTDVQAGCTDLVPEIGITGTPVIDTTTGTLYVVAKSWVNGGAEQYLHAIDVATSAEKFGGPVKIAASVPGAGYDAVGNVVSFSPLFENQRTALLLENGHVVMGWSSHCDVDPYHGWVMSYSASSLAQEAVFNDSPNGKRNGIWMSGGGFAADASGNIYLPTGNGTWNGTSDLGDSIVKLGPPSGGVFPLADYFTPYNQANLASNDIDVAAGGLVLLPALSSGQQLLAQQGKQGTIYLLDRNDMGKYCVNQSPACKNSDPQIVQEIPGASSGIWGSPAFWNNNLYWTGANDHIKAYAFNANGSGLISKAPTSESARTFAFSAPIPSVSSNGNTNGILWALDGSADDSTCDGGGSNCLGLYAYDATNLANVLYSSTQAANNRDSPGNAVKFETPIIANGKVYVGTQHGVSAYGELGVTVPAVFNPAPGSYVGAQTVTLSDSTPGAVIYYTTNGTAPTTSSAVYSAPLQIGATTTIEAFAVANSSASAVTSGTYTITAQGTAPLSVNLGAADNVDGIAANGSPVLKGGLDGSGYAYSASLLGTSIAWSGASFTLGGAGTSDAVSSATIALPAGNDTTLSLLATGVNGNQLNQIFIVTYTDGTTSRFTQSLSDWYTPQNYAGESRALTMAYRVTQSGALDNRTFYLYGYSFALNSAKTVKSITLPDNRNVVVLAIDVTAGATSPSPTLSPAPGSYASAQTVTLSDSTPGAVIYYTTNGTAPTTSSAVYSAPLQIGATTTIEAFAVANSSASAVTSGTYTITAQGTAPLSVNLGAADNVDGIAANGSPVLKGGLDGSGYAYSASLLGTSIAWSGASFTLGGAGTSDAVSSATIALPAGNDTTLSLLATGVNGNQLNQIFIVTYTDGTTSRFTQSLSDWYTPQNYAGESRALTMAYRVTQSGALDNRTFYLYGYSFALNSAKTVKSITLPDNRNVVVLAIDLSGAPAGGATSVSVNLGAADNVDGIAANGSPVIDGGLDGVGNAYSASLLGTSIAWSGASFTLSGAGTSDAVSSATIALPAGNDTTLSLLATGVNGNQLNQIFIVTYTDGTASRFTQSLSDWHTPQSYAGESRVLTMAYRVTQSGALETRTYCLYGYSFALNSAKTVKSITLPDNRSVVVLAIDLTP